MGPSSETFSQTHTHSHTHTHTHTHSHTETIYLRHFVIVYLVNDRHKKLPNELNRQKTERINVQPGHVHEPEEAGRNIKEHQIKGKNKAASFLFKWHHDDHVSLKLL